MDIKKEYEALIYLPYSKDQVNPYTKFTTTAYSISEAKSKFNTKLLYNKKTDRYWEDSKIISVKEVISNEKKNIDN